MSSLGLGMYAEERDRPPRRRGLVIGLIIFLVLALAVVGGIAALASGLVGSKPAAAWTGNGTGTVRVVVNQGDGLTTIGDSLAAAGVVSSAQAFLDAASSDSRASTVQPGTYVMHKHMGAKEALDLLFQPSARIRQTVTIREGLRVDEVEAALSVAMHLPVSQFADVLAHPSTLGLPAWAGGTVEGLLFPATYEIPPGTSAATILKEMVTRFKQAASDTNLVAKAKAARMTPMQALTLASLVQAEGTPPYFAKIARVVLNREAVGMRLQLDTTVLYALKKHTLKVSIADTKVASPYNTYLHDGLPPGPIDSPGQAAIEAALAPATGSWTYFVTTNPTTHETKFTSSFSQFQQFEQEFQANLGS